MKHLFIQITTQYQPDLILPNQLWQELEKNYAHKKRYYHTLAHIENMLQLANKHKALIADWESFVLAIFYHDAVYNVLKTDNEEQSAALAEKRLAQINFPKDGIIACREMILATKQHLVSTQADTNLLLDMDLSVLGADWETYQEYTKQIRREYSIYPDLLYKPGRKKVLEKFLARGGVYKTEGFREKYEAKARENLGKELLSLL